MENAQVHNSNRPGATGQGAGRQASSAAVYIDEIQPGMSSTRYTTLSAADIELFGRISGDLNPIHLDDAYAATTMFRGRIAHGMLTAGLISAVIGQDLPGSGTIYLKQDLEFLAPVRPGDTVEAMVTVAEVNRERRRVALDCACRVAEALVLRGRALVLAPVRAG